jgi:peptide-methionine (S)-S-oxide reductase
VLSSTSRPVYGVELAFARIYGVLATDVGFMGGHLANPTYEQVSWGSTGHAMAVRVTFDPRLVSLQELYGVFFDVHDPTTLDRQGTDVGAQYRSAIFYYTEAQRLVAQKAIADEEARLQMKVVTALEPLSLFYLAEDDHQEYLAKAGQAAHKGSKEPIRLYR